MNVISYKVLTEEERDDIVVEFLLAQERDAYTHSVNIARFDTMLESLPDGAWKTRIQNLRDEAGQRLEEVSSIITATEDQLPPVVRLNAAKSRLSEKQQKTAIS